MRVAFFLKFYLLLWFQISDAPSTVRKSVGGTEAIPESVRRKDMSIESIFLGCFITWDNMEDLISEGHAQFLQGGSDSCSSLCWKEAPRQHVVLKRGDLCICTRWDQILRLSFHQVQLGLCDLPCFTGKSNTEALPGHCGGNFFFSVFCNKYTTKNANENQRQFGTCVVPTEIPVDKAYAALKPEFKVEESELIETCTRGTYLDLFADSRIYLPYNTPMECTLFCTLSAAESGVGDVQSSVGLIRKEYLTNQEHIYNCFCLDLPTASSLSSRNVSDEKCHEPWNKRDPIYISLYTMKTELDWDEVSQDKSHPGNYLIELDTSADILNWRSTCNYFLDYASINSSGNCIMDFESDNEDSLGYWSSCGIPDGKCVLAYSVPEDIVVEFITIEYFTEAFSVDSIILVQSCEEYTCTLLISISPTPKGWYTTTVWVQPPTRNVVRFTLVSEPNALVMIDKIHLTLTLGLPPTPYETTTVTTPGVSETETTTEEPISSTSLTSSNSTITTPYNPPDYDVEVILDVREELNGWSVGPNCVYEKKYDNFFCGNDPVEDDVESEGYWSNCLAESCSLTYVVPAGYSPIFIIIQSYMKTRNASSSPTLTVTHQHGGISDTERLVLQEKWNRNGLRLVNVVPSDVILVKQSSSFLDSFIFIDMILLKVNYTSPTTEPVSAEPSTTKLTTTKTTTTRTTTTTPGPISCSPSDRCNATDHRGVDWSVCSGHTHREPCPLGSIGFVTWRCISPGNFETELPDYSNCSTTWIVEIQADVADIEIMPALNASRYLHQMEKTTSSPSDDGGNISYYGHEIKQIVDLGVEILNKVERTVGIRIVENLTRKTFGVFRNLLTTTAPWNELKHPNKSETGIRLIQSLEATSLDLTLRAKEQVDGAYSKDFNDWTEFKVSATGIEKHKDPIYYPTEYSSQDSFITIPPEWATFFPDQKIVDFVGVDMAPKYANEIFLQPPKSVEFSHQIVNGKLITFTFAEPLQTLISHRRFNLSGEGVRIRFKHEVHAWGNEVKTLRRKLHTAEGEIPKTVLDSSNPCVYWDAVDKRNWSTTGCRVVERTSKYTVCECNHLTSFALLMKTHNYVGKDRALELLTWILCPISIICLAICIGIYSMSSISSLRGPRKVTTNHLSICLLVGNFLLLVFVDRNYIHLSSGFCTTFGIMTHYFFLAVFFWMGFEAYVLYKLVFVIFDDGKDYFGMQYIVSYGGPGIIVLLTGLTAIALKDDAYESDMYCWLSGNYIWAFMGPAAIILSGNSVVLVLSLLKARNLSQNPVPSNTQKRKSKSFLKWAKGCAGLMCLLGVTWAVGYLMMFGSDVVSNIAAYAFTIFNASQGIFLFIFHVVRNKKIRQVLERRLSKWFGNFHSTQRHTSSLNSSKNLPSVDTTLTFGTSCGRRKATVRKHFAQEPKDMKDTIMPNSDLSQKKRKLKVSELGK